MESSYEEAREQARKLYQSIRYVHSHALNERVYFTAAGFNHILFHNVRSERNRTSQIIRFGILERAIKLVAVSTTYQEYEKEIKRFNSKVQGKRVSRNQVVKYWGIIGMVDGVKMRIVLRKVGRNGELHFWSLMPAWTNSRRDQKLLRSLRQ